MIGGLDVQYKHPRCAKRNDSWAFVKLQKHVIAERNVLFLGKRRYADRRKGVPQHKYRVVGKLCGETCPSLRECIPSPSEEWSGPLVYILPYAIRLLNSKRDRPEFENEVLWYRGVNHLWSVFITEDWRGPQPYNRTHTGTVDCLGVLQACPKY